MTNTSVETLTNIYLQEYNRRHAHQMIAAIRRQLSNSLSLSIHKITAWSLFYKINEDRNVQYHQSAYLSLIFFN